MNTGVQSGVIYVPPGDGVVYRVVGPHDIKARPVANQAAAPGAAKSGSFSLMEVPAVGNRPPRRTPQHADEIFYVLEGEYEFRFGDRVTRATPGSLLVAPRDVPHQFRHLGGHKWGKILAFVLPDGADADLAELVGPAVAAG